MKPDEPRITGRFDSEMRSLASTLIGPGGTEQELTAANLQQLILYHLVPIAYRLGLHEFPANVPQTLLSYTDKDPTIKINSLADYLGWYVQQFDALVGQFPIEITIEDTDPLTKGNQTKKIELANVSEALAELFGQGTQTSMNSGVAVNFLMRLASEVIATKKFKPHHTGLCKGECCIYGVQRQPKTQRN